MNKLDLSYLDKIKDRIVKGLNECNIMSDISYTANCVEVLKSLEQTKSLAIDNYRKLQTIEQLEPIDNDNITDNNIQPLYSCPVFNRNGRIYNVETTKEAILEFTNTDTKNVFIINDYSRPVESIPMDEFIAKYDKVIKDAMPALVSRHENLGVNDKIYYEYVTGQKESFIILSVGISGFATKGITIQREEDPNDIYEISLINLHRLFTWRI